MVIVVMMTMMLMIMTTMTMTMMTTMLMMLIMSKVTIIKMVTIAVIFFSRPRAEKNGFSHMQVNLSWNYCTKFYDDFFRLRIAI